MERLDPLFKVQDVHVHEVHLRPPQAMNGIHDRELEVGNEVLQISRHDSGVPGVPSSETTESEIELTMRLSLSDRAVVDAGARAG